MGLQTMRALSRPGTCADVKRRSPVAVRGADRSLAAGGRPGGGRGVAKAWTAAGTDQHIVTAWAPQVISYWSAEQCRRRMQRLWLASFGGRVAQLGPAAAAAGGVYSIAASAGDRDPGGNHRAFGVLVQAVQSAFDPGPPGVISVVAARSQPRSQLDR